MFFACVSRCCTADTSAIGSVLVPAMKKEGYSGAYAVRPVVVAKEHRSQPPTGSDPDLNRINLLTYNRELCTGGHLPSGVLDFAYGQNPAALGSAGSDEGPHEQLKHPQLPPIGFSCPPVPASGRSAIGLRQSFSFQGGYDLRRPDTQASGQIARDQKGGLLPNSASLAYSSDGWRRLKPPQPLPSPRSTGDVDVNGANIHYALYGTGNAEAVLLLHGGLGAAEDFGGQIDALAGDYEVVAIDSRGHGRSTDDDLPYGYHLMAGDVIGVMDILGIDKAAVVGWSDGGNIGLDLAINNSDRLSKVFALGANYQTSGVRPSALEDALIGAYVGYAAAQYAQISPRPDAWEVFSGKVFAMWGSQPAYTDDQLAGIAVPFMIAAGIYEEVIFEAHTRRMADLIPYGQLLLVDNASHFALWQQVEPVNDAILEFLATE